MTRAARRGAARTAARRRWRTPRPSACGRARVRARRPRASSTAPKASRAERDAGCERLPARALDLFPNASGSRKPAGARNPHPTVKPLELMRWLVRLACPPGGLVLDPFCGSGTTGAAAALEGRRFIGNELEPAYTEIARARIAHWAGRGRAAGRRGAGRRR
ncbi:MAG TPA: site-specific DNA-methyltransferase [Solirubrobacterales bacterium]|nr:site-specific DNA-methyltransferase [Solirubrobacterales bacterium]